MKSRHPATLLEELEQLLRTYGPTLVAYSGGVDSAVVAAAAARAHGLLDRPTDERPSPVPMLAVVANAESLAKSELQTAVAVAASAGFPCRVVAHTELASRDYLANNPDRCYHCRSALAARLKEVAAAEGLAVIADGLNADDVGDYRPGIAATDEAGFRHPLLELGIGKAEVRALARELALGEGLSDKPANACLASRVPHGTPITAQMLRMIEAGEAALTRLGFIGHRVRYHAQPTAQAEAGVNAKLVDGGTDDARPFVGGTDTDKDEAGPGGAVAESSDPFLSPALARIELSLPEDIERLAKPEIRAKAVEALKEVGFRWVALDLEGYRMGSMNIVK